MILVFGVVFEVSSVLHSFLVVDAALVGDFVWVSCATTRLV